MNTINTSLKINLFFLYIVLFVAALLPRLLGLTFHSIWTDETSTAIMISHSSFSTMFKAIFEIEGTPPLFFIVEKFFVDTIGILNAFTLRFLPMIFGTLSCVLMFHLVRKISSFRNALLSYILITFSNFEIYLSSEARCYSLFGFLLLVNLVFIIEWWKRPSKVKQFFIIVTLFLLTQVHYYSLFWVISLIISGAFFLPNKKDNQRFILFFLLTPFISYLLLAIPFLNQSQHEVGTLRDSLTSNWLPGIIYSPIKVLLHAYLYKIYSVREISFKDYAGILPVFLILVTSIFTYFYRLKKKEIGIFENFIFTSIAITFLLHCIIGSIVATVHPRYMAHFLVFIFVLIILNMEKIRYLQIISIIVLLSFNILAAINYYSKTIFYIEPYEKISQTIRNFSTSNHIKDKLPIAANYDICHSLTFYFKESKTQFYCIPHNFHLQDLIQTSDFELFGNPFFSFTAANNGPSAINSTTISKMFKQNKAGYFLFRQKHLNNPADSLQRMTGDQVKFSLLKTFFTNQGDISILQWDSKQ